MPLVSVLIPVFNGEKFLLPMLKSLKEQTFTDFEVVIVDDNSTDSSFLIVRKFSDLQIKLVRNKQKLGVAKSLNKGLIYCQGKYIARIDADDIAIAERFKLQVEYLEKYSDVGVLGTGVVLLNYSGEILGRKTWPNKWSTIKRCLPVFNPLIHSSVMFRKKLIDDYGAYDENLNGAEDYDLWLRLAKHTQIINLPKPLVQYRYSQSGISFSNLKQTQRSAIKAQIKSVFRYHYQIWNLIFILKNLIVYLLPYSVIKLLYAKFYAINK